MAHAAGAQPLAFGQLFAAVFGGDAGKGGGADAAMGGFGFGVDADQVQGSILGLDMMRLRRRKRDWWRNLMSLYEYSETRMDMARQTNCLTWPDAQRMT